MSSQESITKHVFQCTAIYPVNGKYRVSYSTDGVNLMWILKIHFDIDSERVQTKFYAKRDDLKFPSVNFPFICSSIPAALAYGVYISQLIPHSTVCDSYQDFKRFTVATNIWLTVMKYLCHKWPRICSTCHKHIPVLSSFVTYHMVCI